MCWHHPKKKANSTFGHFHIATAFHFAHKSVPPKVASGEKHFCICICFQTFSTFTLQLHKFLYLYLLLNFWPLSHCSCIPLWKLWAARLRSSGRRFIVLPKIKTHHLKSALELCVAGKCSKINPQLEISTSTRAMCWRKGFLGPRGTLGLPSFVRLQEKSGSAV